MDIQPSPFHEGEDLFICIYVFFKIAVFLSSPFMLYASAMMREQAKNSALLGCFLL